MASNIPDPDYFRRKLEALEREAIGLTRQVDNSAQRVELDQTRVGRLSRMDAMQGQAIAQAGVESLRRQLQAIRQSQQRIAKGHFGRCLDCDQYIAVARLEIDPTASRCVGCAEQSENN